MAKMVYTTPYIQLPPPPSSPRPPTQPLAKMVLEEVAASQELAFSDSSPSSDADPYAGDGDPTILPTRQPSVVPVNQPPHQVYINLSALPRTFGLSASKAFPQPAVNAIVESCKQASQVLERPVTQQEAEALAFHFAKSVRISSYGVPLGMTIGSLMAYRGLHNFRIPGLTLTEKEWFSPEKFGPLRGRLARYSWHAVRLNIYWFVGSMAGSIFFGSYALTLGTAGRMMDPRLQEFREKIQERARKGSAGLIEGGAMQGGRQRDETPGPRDGETYNMAKQRQRAQDTLNRGYRVPQQEVGNTQAQEDDMSPTGGALRAEFGGLASDTGMMSDVQARRQTERIESQQRAEYTTRSGPESELAATRRQQRVSDDSSRFGEEGESRSKQTGSAWERLRQQATSGPPLQPSPRSARSPNQPSGGESFAFSSTDEEKQLARSEAQREFDARIERERSGKDFSDVGDGRGRW